MEHGFKSLTTTDLWATIEQIIVCWEEYLERAEVLGICTLLISWDVKRASEDEFRVVLSGLLPHIIPQGDTGSPITWLAI
jgi:hypothetical protein